MLLILFYCFYFWILKNISFIISMVNETPLKKSIVLYSDRVVTSFSMEKICFPFLHVFYQYSHKSLQTIENQTRSFSVYKELIPIKEERRKVYIVLKVSLFSLCTIDCYRFYF